MIFYRLKQFSRCLKDGLPAGHLLPATYSHVYVERVEIHPVANAPGPLGCEQRGARPHETIEHDVAAMRDIANGVCDECYGLAGRVGVELLHPLAAKAVNAGVPPHIGSIASVFTELDVID